MSAIEINTLRGLLMTSPRVVAHVLGEAAVKEGVLFSDTSNVDLVSALGNEADLSEGCLGIPRLLRRIADEMEARQQRLLLEGIERHGPELLNSWPQVVNLLRECDGEPFLTEDHPDYPSAPAEG